MHRVIYCDRFYCEHWEDEKCLSPVLHLAQGAACAEYAPSEEKFNRRMEALDEKQGPSLPKPVVYRFGDIDDEGSHSY